MPRYSADRDQVEVVTIREILFIFATFSIILFFVYPGKIQKEQVLQERSNYALSALYLANMLRLEPENKELIFASIKAEMENNQIDLAKEHLNILKESPTKEDIKRMRLLEYDIYAIEVEHSQDKNVSQKIKQKMKDLMLQVVKEGAYNAEHAFVWYQYALALSQKKTALAFLEPIYMSGDTYALEQCVYLAGDLNLTKQRDYCIAQLSKGDSNTTTWLQSAYVMYTQRGDQIAALKALRKLAKKDAKYQEELANVELRQNNFSESAKTYLLLYGINLDPDIKKNYLLKAIQTYVYGKDYNAAVELMKKHEDEYIGDADMVQEFIKLYLSMQKLSEAKELSIKLMKERKIE